MRFFNTPKSCTLHLQLVIYFTLYRNHAVNPMTKLLLALRFLATGYFFICAGDTMGVSKTSAHDFIQVVLDAIVELRPEFIHFPTTPQEIRQVVRKFYSIALFPRVIGSLDCTHIRVQNPGNVLMSILSNIKIN